MSYCVTSVMDTPFLPAEKRRGWGGGGGRGGGIISSGAALALARGSALASPGLTRPCRASHPVDVDLGEAGGVVVDDDLNRWNIQATGWEESGNVAVNTWQSWGAARQKQSPRVV